MYLTSALGKFFSLSEVLNLLDLLQNPAFPWKLREMRDAKGPKAEKIIFMFVLAEYLYWQCYDYGQFTLIAFLKEGKQKRREFFALIFLLKSTRQ